MTAVTEMHLHTNKIGGMLPAEWHTMSSMQVFTARENRLRGTLNSALLNSRKSRRHHTLNIRKA